ncbi:hypothetical protein Agabi119p4_10365 [Agaricus bisporus var. burnettii]|uniref:Uncharacterized protein n=1 Tax=Agaricus bisporus var. burnettii TaxID=192524 RepID=A0A8H7C2U6_AGABI|nr:hypothetical protein Agabi119p4_10365 [Agaricus bisporus var. burnettii]
MTSTDETLNDALSRRPNDWPSVTRVGSHPLVPAPDSSTIFVLKYQDGQTQAKAQQQAFKTQAPQSVEEAVEKGIVVLHPRDRCYVFLCDPEGRGADHDVLLGMTMSYDELSKDNQADLRQLRERVIGEPKDGLIAYEQQTERVAKNGRGEHCHTVGLAYQKPRTMTAPHVTMKQSLGESMALPREVLSCAIAGLREKAGYLLDLMDDMAMIYNTPRIGCHQNTCYPAMQINVARAVDGTQVPEDGHISALGEAGNPHYDPQDSAVGLTCMLNLSRPHANVDDEVFTVLGLGLAFVIPPLSGIYFSGLYLHTGRQPVYRPGIRAEEGDYYRVTLICYPARDVLHNHGCLALGPGPDGGVLTHKSEQRTSWIPPPKTEHANFLRDGLAMMDRRSYIEFVMMCFYQQLEFQLHDVDRSFDLRLDAERFVEAFSYVDGTNQRVSPRPFEGLDRRARVHEKSKAIANARKKWVGPLHRDQGQKRKAEEGLEAEGRRSKRKRGPNKGEEDDEDEDEDEDEEEDGDGDEDDDDDEEEDGDGDEDDDEDGDGDGDEDGDEDERIIVSDGSDAQPMEIDHTVFKVLGTFPAVTETDVQLAIRGVTSRETSIDLDAPVAAAGGELNLAGTARLVASRHLALARYWALHNAKPIMGAIYLMLNVLVWETLEREAKLSYQPHHPLHVFRTHVEQYNLEKMKKRSRPVIEWSGVCPSVPCPSGTTSVRYTPAVFKTKDKVGNGVFREGEGKIEDQMVSLLALFCDLPLKDRWQAIFTRVVIDRLGVAMLFVDSVSAFLNCTVEHTLGVLAHPSKEFVQARSLFHASRLKVDLTTSLGVLYAKVCAGWADYQWLFSTVVAGTQNQGICREPVGALMQGVEESNPFVTRLDLLPAPTRRVLDRHPALRKLALILYLSLPLLDDPDATSSDRLHRMFLNVVKAKLDKRLPFRDAAPSRRRILEGDGPFSDRYLTTASGFFSALIFRGITISTQFLFEQPTLFRNLAAWKASYRPHMPTGEHRNDDVRLALDAWKPVNPYVCCVAAYGNSAPARHPLNARKYWKDAEKWAEDTKLLERGSYSCLEFYNLVKRSKLRAFGTLTSYLLTADYVSAGLVRPMTDEEAGTLIKSVGAGARKGLTTLGYSVKTTADITKAFREVRSTLEMIFTEEEKAKMGYGGVMLEHALCKLARLGKLKVMKKVFKEYLE